MNQPSPIDEVTAIIKTFESPLCLDRLIRSIRRFYPGLRVLVADDSIHPKPRDDVQYIRLPPDVGLSAGRNALLARVDTPFFLLLDDDFEFHAATRIDRLARVVATGRVSIAAGEFLNLRWKRKFWGLYKKRKLRPSPYHGLIERDGDQLKLTRGCRSQEDDYFLCDLVNNFFVARTSDVKAMGGWDEDLKLNEHLEFFLRAKQHGLPVAYIPQVSVLHWRERSAGYDEYRNRDYVGLAMRKHGINVLRDLNGFTKIYGISRAA